MAFKLPRFDRTIPVVNPDFSPSLTFHVWWQEVVKRIEVAINGIQSALEAAGIAQAAAEAAQAAAESAEGTGGTAERIASLTNSGTIGLTLGAADAGTDATVTISNHTRAYGNGDSVSVIGGSLTGLDYSTFYYLYYDDPERDGGTVTYQYTELEADAVQTGDRHLVGSITTPAAAGPDTTGGTVRPPGVGNIYEK